MVGAEEKKHCDDPSNSSSSLDIQRDDTSSSLDQSNSNQGVASVASSTASTSYYKSRQRRPPGIPKVTTPRRTSRGGVSSSSSSSSDDESSRDDKNEEEEIRIPSYHNSRAAAKHGGRPNSSTDDRTSGDSTSTSYAADTNPNNSASSPGVSPDQERQILLLMLLAQVCALHDPTPRTFTVHVLELFERGILGRQSIHFLFELGLVPSTAPRLLPPSTTAMETNGSGNDHVLDLATVSPTVPTSPQSLRAQEASAIRNHLEQHDLAQEAAAANVLPAQGGFSSTALASSNDSPTKNKSSSWAVEHHPLSLSRYQREFHQVRLLNAGSFGEVFQATSKIDLRDYAVKRVAFSAWGYSKDSVTQVIREVHCLAQCDHPNVVRYYTSWLEPSWMTGSGATMITSTGSTSAEVRHQQKLLTDIQHMMITGGADALDQSQLQSQSQQSFGSENNSNNNNSLQDFFFQRDRTATRKFSVGSSLDSLDSAGSSYDETSSEEEEEDYGGSYSHPHWNASAHGDDPIGSRDDSILFESHRREVWESSSSAPRRCKTQGNNTNKKQPAKLRYRYQICLFIQMQLCHPATLGDWIRNRNLQSADPNQDRHERVQTAIKIFSQIVSGLNHIHKKNIIHRDLKPANLFRSLEEDGVFLIGDFGLSKLIHSATHRGKHQNHYHSSDGANNTVYHTTPEYPDAAASAWQDPLTAGVGTASYAANEQVTTRTYGKPADIFSLGLILLELVCCFCTEHERMQTFYDCRNRREVPSWITEEYPTIASTILACTNSDPQKRPTAEQLVVIDLLYAPSTEAGFDGSGESNRKEDPVLVVAELRQELEAKNKLIQSYKEQLVEKDQTIAGLEKELELLKQNHNTTTTTHIEYVNTTTSVTVEEVTSPISNIDSKDANSK